ncbi:MAG: HlyD family secretion protein, partial [Bythopirellula sp.]
MPFITLDRKLRMRSGASGIATLLLFAVVALTVIWGALQFWNAGAGESNSVDAILHEVSRDDFVLSVTERGEIQSAGVTEIRSEVKTKNTPGLAILRIIPEGSKVEQGDFLVELDASALEAELASQQISCNTVEALVIEARNLHQTAVIAKREYLEGTYVEARQTIESEVFVAEEKLNRAQEYYEYSKKLATKGYVNDLQLEADKFAVEKSRKELEAAKTKLKVLDEFTKAKTVVQLESDILIAKAKWEANKNSHQIELDKLKDIEHQIAKSTILAPKGGVVMYAHERDRRGNSDFIVEEGAVVRERQAILHIPDSQSMRVEIEINESLIQFVKARMPTTIEPVGMGDIVLKGTVDKVNRYAEPSGWRKANVKEYKAFVNVDNAPAELRVGLTASVTIECAFVPDAIKVPVQAVYAHGKKFFCLVFQGDEWTAHEVTCG